MKNRLILFLVAFISWTLYFLVARAMFLVYHAPLVEDLSFGEVLLVFAHGSRMDFSMAGYFTIFPGLLLGVLFFARGKVIWPIWFGYQVIALTVATFIIVLDFELYKHWGFRLDATPLLYMGKEAAGSGDPLRSVLLILYAIAIIVVWALVFRRYFKNLVMAVTPAWWPAMPAILLLTALLIIPIRGSLGVAPMNSGFVYFHPTKVFANHAAVNVVWNFFYAVQKMNRLKYADGYFDREKTAYYFSSMFPAPDSTGMLLKTKRPNLILIVLESYSSGLIGALGGLPDVTPRFNELVREGILFDHFYASGDRTDKGIISILNGYPAQPLTSLVKEPKKTLHLPYLNKVLKGIGYQTEFTYGYNINYANFNSYLMHGNFDHITHSMDFPQDLNTSKWGVHDHYVFNKFLGELDSVRTPFFKVMMTQSSHEPFDVPMETVIPGEDDISRFLNSAYYTDKSLGEFIDKAKERSWWDETLIVITADHGHIYPNNQGVSNPDRFKIPMLWLGGALAVRDTVIHTLGCQPDIPNTILGQYGIYEPSFEFSHNILSESYKPFAIFVYNNGFGIIKPDGQVVYDNIASRVVKEEGVVHPEDLDEGKSYMQKLYWDFNAR